MQSQANLHYRQQQQNMTFTITDPMSENDDERLTVSSSR